MQRFFFVHVQKTGGTELRERLKRRFDMRSLYPNKTDGDLIFVAPQVSVTQLLARWELRKDEIEIVTGHFPLATKELLDAEFVTLTVLREPVERTLSHLRHFRKLNVERHEQSLDEIYAEAPIYRSLRNHMVKMFSMTSGEVVNAGRENVWPVVYPIELTREHLERAKERLAEIDVFGLQDHFEEFCLELHGRFGWDLGAPLYANRTQESQASDSLRARIAEENAMDVELWEFAQELYAERRGEVGRPRAEDS